MYGCDSMGGVDGQISNCILIINTVSVDLLLLLLYPLDAHEEALAENCKERDMSNMAREPCVKANNGVRRAKFVIQDIVLADMFSRRSSDSCKNSQYALVSMVRVVTSQTYSCRLWCFAKVLCRHTRCFQNAQK